MRVRVDDVIEMGDSKGPNVIALVVLYVLAAFAISFQLWDLLSKGEPSTSVNIRNLVLMWGTPLAIFLAVWRSIVAQKQVEVAQAGLLSDRYQRAVEMLGHDKPSIRLGGIHALRNLTFEHPSAYQMEVVELLRVHQEPSSQDPASQKIQAVLDDVLIDITPGGEFSGREPANRLWKRLLLWLKNLCKCS